MSTILRELDRCVFCGGSDMTEEHLIADWALRAFAMKRKPDGVFRGQFVRRDQLQLRSGDGVLTAKVICRACNNGWLSGIDNAAGWVLKPLIRGRNEVTLDRAGQTATAAWIYKCALILDAADHGPGGALSMLRAGFMESRLAGAGCQIVAGPASTPPTLDVGDPPTTVNLWMIGTRPVNGTMNLTVNARSVDGKTITPGTPRQIPIPGYQVMVGALWAYLGGRILPVTGPSLIGFQRVWPAQDEPVTIRAASLVTARPAA